MTNRTAASRYARALLDVALKEQADLATIEQSNYAATTHIGKMGVEKSREQVLHGRVGYQKVEVNAQGRILRVVERTPPVPGTAATSSSMRATDA